MRAETTTYGKRKKQPATRGDVSSGEGAKPKFRNRGCRGRFITTRFTAEEAGGVEARAEAAGMKVSEYIRRELLRPAGVSPDTALVLTEVGRVRELLTRLTAVGSEEDLDARRVFEIASSVEAIDPRVFVAQATGVKQ